jgi:hypothetical protein
MPLRAPGGNSLSLPSNAPEHSRAYRLYRTHSHTMASSEDHSALGGQESIPQPPAEGFVSVFTNNQRVAYPSSQNANPHTDENILAISVDGLPISTLTQPVTQKACRRVGQSSSGSTLVRLGHKTRSEILNLAQYFEQFGAASKLAVNCETAGSTSGKRASNWSCHETAPLACPN